jgi:hypothetical protein
VPITSTGHRGAPQIAADRLGPIPADEVVATRDFLWIERLNSWVCTTPACLDLLPEPFRNGPGHTSPDALDCCESLEESAGSNRAEGDVSTERVAAGHAKPRIDADGDDGTLTEPRDRRNPW